MSLLAEDESNALRCAALEGLATLALSEPSLRSEAEALIEHETLDASEIEELVETGKLSKPPRSTPSTTTPPPPESKAETIPAPGVSPGPAPANA